MKTGSGRNRGMKEGNGNGINDRRHNRDHEQSLMVAGNVNTE